MNYQVVKTVSITSRERRHIVRAIIDGVPDGTGLSAIREAIDTAGFTPTEDGIPWGNCSIRRADKEPAAEVPADVQRWSWATLTASEPAVRQLNVRIRRTTYARCENAA